MISGAFRFRRFGVCRDAVTDPVVSTARIFGETGRDAREI